MLENFQFIKFKLLLKVCPKLNIFKNLDSLHNKLLKF